jgi:hypothetical protein
MIGRDQKAEPLGQERPMVESVPGFRAGDSETKLGLAVLEVRQQLVGLSAEQADLERAGSFAQERERGEQHPMFTLKDTARPREATVRLRTASGEGARREGALVALFQRVDACIARGSSSAPAGAPDERGRRRARARVA